MKRIALTFALAAFLGMLTHCATHGSDATETCQDTEPVPPDAVECLRTSYALAGDVIYMEMVTEDASDLDWSEVEDSIDAARDRASLVRACVGEYMREWNEFSGVLNQMP